MKLFRGNRAAGPIALLASLAGLVAASDPVADKANPPMNAPNRKLVSVGVYPAEVQLTTLRDFQSLVVQAVYDDGVTEDVTDKSKYTFTDPKLCKFENFSIQPAADGATDLLVEYADQKIKVPVTVKQAAVERLISFKLDVMPIFMRAGCNSGTCHGAARGKDGFRLSLFGYDPDGDHFRLTREAGTRRVNLSVPHECLMIEKATGKVPHTGGKRVEPNSPNYGTLIRWLEANTPLDPPTVATPISLEILPRKIVLEGKDSKQRMTAIAKYSDGTDRDVTDLVIFLTNNDNSAKISESGVVTAAERGEAFVMARFATFTVGSQVIVIPKGAKYEWPNPVENNYIDTMTNAKLKKLRIIPSDLCSDEEFLRRATVDIAGMLPTKEEFDRFVVNSDPKKREKLVDELLSRKEFVDIWVMKFAELLQIRSTNDVTYKSTLQYYNWLQDRFNTNTPMDKIVRELLAASGGTFRSPATNYYQIEKETLKVSENVAQVFMGMRIQCAQCHNHPFDRWTMDDYYGFAAFFSQIGRKAGEDPRELIIFNSFGGEVAHPVGGRQVIPKLLGAEEPKTAGKDRREVMVDWLASPKNPYFAKNLGNIVWAHFFGKGIIDPVDDVRVSNPPVNPELLEELAKRFTEYNYDFKRLVRDICNSRTYQLSTKTNPTNEADERNFSRSVLRRIRAEVMLDVVTQVTETKNKFPGLPLGARAVQIADGNVSTYFLTTFGRASRETVCSCEVKMDPNLSQALHLLNGDTTAQRIAGGGVIQRAIEAKKTPEQIIDELFIRCLARKPRAEELKSLKEQLASDKDTKRVLEDVFWAILNSKEFMFNH